MERWDSAGRGPCAGGFSRLRIVQDKATDSPRVKLQYIKGKINQP